MVGSFEKIYSISSYLGLIPNCSLQTIKKMTLTTLVISVAIIAAFVTGLMKMRKEDIKNLLVSYLQNFTGVLFIFSGLVKAVDPLGTAYKMEQYFSQFEVTFSETALSFITPIFPILATVSIAFSVSMIVFEIVLGVMLILGNRQKLTAWLFFLLVFFFLILTGFTYLTGYVPNDVNFFAFGSWSSFNEANMKVTDCGCFGDFLKLKPKVSFFKDVFLMIPAILFLMKSKEMHQLFTKKTRMYAALGTTVLFTAFCLYNFVYDLPLKDFRPFANTTDVRTGKAEQIAKISEAPIFFIYRNPQDTTEVKSFSDKELDQIPEGWEYFDRIQEKIETNKLFDFVNIQGKTITKTTYLMYDTGEGEPYLELAPEDTLDGGVEDSWVLVETTVDEQVTDTDVSEQILNNPNPHFMIVCHDLKKTNKSAFATKVANLQKEAEAKGIEFYAVVGKVGTEEIEEFQKGMGIDFPFYIADDILLKTIVRSNPGIVLWNDGTIVHKWHHRHLPSMEEISAEYLK
jgi:uncharacterized membrane protein YphA (DoxX/SURF4 family)